MDRIDERHPVRALERADIAAGKALARLGEVALIRRAAALGVLADQPPMVALSAGVAVGGALLGDARLARTGVRMLAAHALATLAKGWVKARVDRHRPHVADGDHRVKPGAVGAHGDRSSFPSGHSAGAVAVARAIAREYPVAGPPALGIAGGLALAQLPAARHFPLDLAAGAAIGAAAEAAVAAVAGGARRLAPQASAAFRSSARSVRSQGK